MHKLKHRLEEAGYEVIWPHEAVSGSTPSGIFKGCRDLLDDCDTLVAVLDGSQVDDGTAWELGYWYSKKRPREIFGAQVRFRRR